MNRDFPRREKTPPECRGSIAEVRGKRKTVRWEFSGLTHLRKGMLFRIKDCLSRKSGPETTALAEKLLSEKISLAGIAGVSEISESRLQKYVNKKYENITHKIKGKMTNAMKYALLSEKKKINYGYGLQKTETVKKLSEHR